MTLAGLAIAAALAPSAREPAIVDLVARGPGHCALRDDGRVVCWGRHPTFPALVGEDVDARGPEALEVPTVVPKIPPLVELALGWAAWGVTATGKLVSWGAGRGAETPALGIVRDVVAVDLKICVRLDDGGVKCWHESLADEGTWELRAADGSALPAGDLRPSSGNAFEIHGEDRIARIDLDEAWEVAGTAERRVPVEHIVRRAPTWERAYAQRRLGIGVRDATIAGNCLLADGRVWCWRNGTEWGYVPEVLGHADAFDMTEHWACLGHGERVRCLSPRGGEVSFDLGARVTMVRARGREGVFGADDGRVLAVDLHEEHVHVRKRAEIRVPGVPIAAAGGRGSMPCVALREGTLHCTGEGTVSTHELAGTVIGGVDGRIVVRAADGRLDRIASDGTVKTLHAKSDAAFVIGGDAMLVVSGADFVLNERGRDSTWLVPADLDGHAPLRDRPAIARNDLQSCVIAEAGRVYCTRPSGGTSGLLRTTPLRSGPWTSAVPLPGPAAALVGDGRTMCARLQSGEVACWGGRFGGPQGLAPEGEITDRVRGAR